MHKIYKLNRSFIFQIFIVLYTGSEIGLIASDNISTCQRETGNQKVYFSIYIGIFSCILILNILSLIYVAKKKQVFAQEIANIIISILLQEYINLDTQIYSLTFCIIILIILYSYSKLLQDCKNHLALLVLLLHLGYIFLRNILNSSLNKQQIFQFSIVLLIVLIKVLPFQENACNLKDNQDQSDLGKEEFYKQQFQDNVKQIPQIVIANNNNMEQNMNNKMKQYLQKNDNQTIKKQISKLNDEINNNTTQLKNDSKLFQTTSSNNIHEKFHTSIPIYQNNIYNPQINQANITSSYFNTLSTGVLFINDKKNIFSKNDAFLNLANSYLLEQEDLDTSNEGSQEEIKKDQLLNISLVYEIKNLNNQKLKKQFLKNEQFQQSEIKLADGQKQQQNVEVKQIDKQNIQESFGKANSLYSDQIRVDQNDNNIKQNSDIQEPDANKLMELILREKELNETNQKKMNIKKNKEKQKQGTQNINELMDSRKIKQDLNVSNSFSEGDIIAQNKDQRSGNLNTNQSSFYNNNINNSLVYCLSENFQQHNTYMETDSAMNYNDQHAYHEFNDDLFQSNQIKKKISQNQEIHEILQRSKQCHLSLSEVTEFFKTEIQQISLGELVDFILEQKSQVVADKEVIELSSSQVPEDYKNQKNPKSKQSMQLGSYMVKVKNDYIVISMIRKNLNYSKSQNEVIEFKIGCFYYEQIIKTKETTPSTHHKQSKQILDSLIQFKRDNKQSLNQKTQLNKQSTFKNKSLVSCGQIIENNIKDIENSQIQEQSEIYKSNYYLKGDSYVEKKYFITVEAYEVGFNIQKTIEKDIDKFRSKILCSISHELRTPLNCIITMLDMLNIRDDVPEISKNLFVNPALFSSYILLNIINDILDMAEVNRTGQISMIFSEFCPVTVCLECLNFIKLQAVQKNLQLEIYCEDNVPSIIYTDINKTRQVILNLLNNALKYTQKGTITIKLSYPYDQTVQIEVKDTGCGIPSNDLKQIFRNFVKPDIDFRRHSSIKKHKFSESNNSKSNKNAGLGLSISYFLAACLGNNRKLSVSSEVGKGSTFSFFLVSRSQNKTGCTLFPMQAQQSNNMSSIHSREWLECENQQNKHIPQLFQQQTTQSIVSTHFNEIENQLHSSPSILKGGHDQQEEAQNDLKEKKIVSCKTIRNNLHFNKKNNSSNCIHFSHTAPIQEETESNIYISKEEITPKADFKRQKTKRNTSFLASNFNKTALQMIQQATTLQKLYSAHEIDDQCNSSQKIVTNSGIVPFFTQEQKTRSRTISKKFTSDEQENSFFRQTSLNSISYKNKNEQQQSQGQCSKELESNQRQLANLNIHSTSPKKQMFIYRNHSSSSKFIKDKTNQDMQEEILNFDLVFKRMKNEDIMSSLQVNSPTIKSHKKERIESCNVLNDSFDKKHPNSSFSPHMGTKPSLSIPNLFNQKRSTPESINYYIQQSQTFNPDIKNQRNSTGIQVFFQSHQNSANNLNLGHVPSILSPSLLQLTLNIDEVQNQKFNIDVSQDKSQNMSINPSNVSQSCLQTNEDLLQILINQNRSRKCSCPQILIVDDSEFNIYALEIRLQMYSFTLSKAINGFQAIEHIQKQSENSCCKNYKLIFMDIDMPKKNGYETTEEIIKLSQKLSITVPPISAYSALIQESDKEQAFKSGMSYYLTKPINHQAFDNILIKAIINKQ